MSVAVSEQVIGVLDGSLAKHGGGVEGQPELPLWFEKATPARHLQAALERQSHLLVQDELGAEQLQRRLGERTLFHLQTQRHLPARVKGCPLPRLLVGNPVVYLQQQRRRQQARRHARPAPSRGYRARRTPRP